MNAQVKSDQRITGREMSLVCLLVLGLGCAASLSYWIEAHRPPVNIAQAEEEVLYVKPEAARRMSLGFSGLVADWYWMRALQYTGRKMDAYRGDLQIDDLRVLRMKLLAPLLDGATTLDPQFMAAYEYSAVVLPTVDAEAGIKLVQKGIDANPQAWRLYHQLGYIYWQQGRFREAADTYRKGSQIAGAPAWMNAMSANMLAKGGSRETARAIYQRMYEQADNEQLKLTAYKRLLQLQSWDQQDAIRRVLADYRARAARCPDEWHEVAPLLRALRLPLDQSDAPLDPLHVPYTLVRDSCDVALDAKSEIPRK